ncbi:2709_t:CDS:2 [Paraglomus brasilianum]|uniref:2709_t:CDS:1 n=1 Tax=Paraglomus brasilianum TaxID=144538 RepID=A0A9N9AK56_9GLOM|nr:2709_t:CDS:2 [Paraglomus brasilianum]
MEVDNGIMMASTISQLQIAEMAFPTRRAEPIYTVGANFHGLTTITISVQRRLSPQSMSRRCSRSRTPTEDRSDRNLHNHLISFLFLCWGRRCVSICL